MMQIAGVLIQLLQWASARSHSDLYLKSQKGDEQRWQSMELFLSGAGQSPWFAPPDLKDWIILTRVGHRFVGLSDGTTQGRTVVIFNDIRIDGPNAAAHMQAIVQAFPDATSFTFDFTQPGKAMMVDVHHVSKAMTDLGFQEERRTDWRRYTRRSVAAAVGSVPLSTFRLFRIADKKEWGAEITKRGLPHSYRNWLLDAKSWVGLSTAFDDRAAVTSQGSIPELARVVLNDVHFNFSGANVYLQQHIEDLLNAFGFPTTLHVTREHASAELESAIQRQGYESKGSMGSVVDLVYRKTNLELACYGVANNATWAKRFREILQYWQGLEPVGFDAYNSGTGYPLLKEVRGQPLDDLVSDQDRLVADARVRRTEKQIVVELRGKAWVLVHQDAKQDFMDLSHGADQLEFHPVFRDAQPFKPRLKEGTDQVYTLAFKGQVVAVAHGEVDGTKVALHSWLWHQRSEVSRLRACSSFLRLLGGQRNTRVIQVPKEPYEQQWRAAAAPLGMSIQRVEGDKGLEFSVPLAK